MSLPALTPQPNSSWTVYGSKFTDKMVGAWSLSSPGIGGKVHNHAPFACGLTQTSAIMHGLISNPYASNGWGNWWGTSLTMSDNVAEATGTWVDLGDPIGTNDDVSVLVGFVPFSTNIPSGTGAGNIFGRGNDGSGAGWSLLCGWNASNVMQFADVSSGGQHTSTITGGLIPYQPNFFCGTYKQSTRTQCCLNGRLGNAAATAAGLRTSTKGCYLGKQPGASSTSHTDNILFCFLWRRAMETSEMQFLTREPWVLWTNPTDWAPIRPGAFSYTASGGIVFGGAATTANARAAIAYSFSASGGITFAGTASPPKYNKLYTASGGISFSGAAAGIVADVAQVRFDIFRASSNPLLVSFDIESDIPALDPVEVEFDIFTAANSISAQFDIFSEGLRNARLDEDIQRPIAEVTIQ